MLGKLQEGQVIKNYKELCKLLGVKEKTGNSKIAQMKEIESYYKLRKQGYKFIVEEVYQQQQKIIDGRKNNGGHISNTKYETLMDDLIINLLLTKNDYCIEQSFTKIMDMLGFFNVKFEHLRKSGYKIFANKNKLGTGLVLTYQQKLINIVRKCLETSLNRLHKQGVIEYEKNININDGYIYEIADVVMKRKISKTEKKIYKQMDITHHSRILPQINRQFKRKVSDELDILNYWNIYCIRLIDQDTKQVDEDRDELKRRLIKSIVDAVKKHKCTDRDGNIYYSYKYPKYQQQIEKMNQLIWILPDDYNANPFQEVDIDKMYRQYDNYNVNQYDDVVPF